jgi:hypothetical protein
LRLPEKDRHELYASAVPAACNSISRCGARGQRQRRQCGTLWLTLLGLAAELERTLALRPHVALRPGAAFVPAGTAAVAAHFEGRAALQVQEGLLAADRVIDRMEVLREGEVSMTIRECA